MFAAWSARIPGTSMALRLPLWIFARSRRCSCCRRACRLPRRIERGVGGGPRLILSLASIDKTNALTSLVYSSRWLPNRIRSVKQVLLALGKIWARHEWAPHFSIDKNNTLSSTGSLVLGIQWFGDHSSIPLDKSSTFSAYGRSGTTNTVLSEAASSKRIEFHFARQNKCF